MEQRSRARVDEVGRPRALGHPQVALARVLTAVLVLATLCGGCAPAGADTYGINNWPSFDWRFFSARSPWNSVINHAVAQVDPNSGTMIRKLVADGLPSAPSLLTIRRWGVPLYFGGRKHPRYRLRFTDRNDYTRDIAGRRIHVPRRAKPATGSDGVMWVIDQTHDWAFMLQRARVHASSRIIRARRGYRLAVSGIGFRYPDGPPTGVQPIRPEELAAGYVNHAMSMGVRCLSGHPVPPFAHSITRGRTCRGDHDPATTRLSIGNVVFLDMSHAQIDGLPVPRWQKAILLGLADYGAVIGLNGDNAWALKFENPIDRTTHGKRNPYRAAGLPSTLDYSHALDSVGGWGAHLKVLAPFSRPCSGIC